MIRAVARGAGAYLPATLVTNDELATRVDTSDAWIRERTGITQRYIAAEGQSTADMAAEAAKAALVDAGMDAGSLDLLIVATTTPDNTFPSTATKVQHLIGMKQGAAFDIQAVCSGFVYGMSMAQHFIASGQYQRVMVIGAEKITSLLDWTDRGTCVLFGDGAGAILFEAVSEGEAQGRGILQSKLYSDGSTRDLLYVDGGVATTQTTGKLRMQGQEVFKHAVQKLVAVTQEVLAMEGVATEQVDWVIPHQANMRILDAVVKRLNIPREKLIATVDRHANTSAASIPLAIAESVREGKIKPGDLLAIQAIGGGLTWGACLLRW